MWFCCSGREKTGTEPLPRETSKLYYPTNLFWALVVLAARSGRCSSFSWLDQWSYHVEMHEVRMYADYR